MLLKSPTEQPFWLRLVVIGFAAFGAVCFAGMVVFFLGGIANRRPSVQQLPAASKIPSSAPALGRRPEPARPSSAELGLQPLPTPEQVRAAVAAQGIESADSISESSSLEPAPVGSLSEYALKQVSTARIYATKARRHIEASRAEIAKGNYSTACSEIDKAISSTKAIFNSVEPVAREVQILKPEAMKTILAQSEALTESLDAAHGTCREMGF